MAPRRILFGPTTQISGALPRKVSSSHLGTAYELWTLDLLSSHPYHMSLIRVGGANDKGVDLRGRWNLTNNLPSPTPSSPRGSPSIRSSRCLDVIVQCKAERAALRPSILREFEGVLQNQSHPYPSFATTTTKTNRIVPLGILVSLNGFSKQTLNRSVESRWPLSLVHLSIGKDRLRLDENGNLIKDFILEDAADQGEGMEPRQVITWTRNQAWKELVGDGKR